MTSLKVTTQSGSVVYFTRYNGGLLYMRRESDAPFFSTTPGAEELTRTDREVRQLHLVEGEPIRVVFTDGHYYFSTPVVSIEELEDDRG